MESRESSRQQTWLAIGIVSVGVLCVCVGVALLAGGELMDQLGKLGGIGQPEAPSTTAEIRVAVSPGMAPTFAQLAEAFNAQGLTTPDGTPMEVTSIPMVPEEMVEQSLSQPSFQAIAPDSSLWLSLLDRQWAEQYADEEDESVIPLGRRRFGSPVRYATSPVVIAAWESTASELGWPEQAIGWQDIQQQATSDPNFKWNHPSTGHASGLLATLSEFYAGAGLTRGLTPEAATAEATLNYVRDVEATVRFYGEGEDVIVQRLSEEGKDFLDAFVTQEQVVLAWNRQQAGERLVAIYPAEGTLWADHPLALLEFSGPGETPLTDNQHRTYQALVDYLLSAEAQRRLLSAGYRPADMDIRLDQGDSPFVGSTAVDWRQPQTTLQIPSARVVEVVRNVWWYTKRPTNVFLVVDVSGSMEDDDKMELTQAALRSFVEQIQGERDQVGLITFASSASVVRPLQPLDDAGREDLLNVIDKLRPQGQTALIDGVVKAYSALVEAGDTEAINAIVVMTDGMENASGNSIESLQRHLNAGGPPVVIFTIAFGKNADESVMRQIAEMADGQFRRADETDIEELYKIISTYF